ncbi:MAG: response regulator [Desulfuromonas sp.]|nr:response regulator [Desulfuromonas sp.]
MLSALKNDSMRDQLLLVDDNATNLDTLLATLGDRYDLRVAVDGKTAINLIDDGYLPDLILLDVMMPEMDGYEVCRHLKAKKETCDIPVIFLSALDSNNDEAKGLELGAVDYITKPFFPAIVCQRINTHLELKHHRDKLQNLVVDKTDQLTTAYNDLKKVHDQMVQQEKMASLGQLAAGVAHEINNPAGFVSSNIVSLEKYVGRLSEWALFVEQILPSVDNPEIVSLLQEKKRTLKLDYILEDVKDLISESKDGIERIAAIVRNMKSFCRAEGDTFKSLNVHDCLDSALSIAHNEIKYKATVKREYAELPPIHVLPQQLGQVFVNLLVNAAQAIEQQGTITVRTTHENEWAVVKICDTGSGITPEHLQRLFEPFFTTKEVGRGTGLGLSICADIIQKHQGTITVDSTVGEGTCFTIKLPLVERREG